MTIKTVNLPLYWCTKHNQSWSSGRIIKVFGLENCYSPWKNLVKRRTAREGESGDFLLKNGFFILSSTVFSKIVIWSVNPLSANITKWPNIFRQFVVKWPTNCLSVFDHFVVLALKVFKKKKKKKKNGWTRAVTLNWIGCKLLQLFWTVWKEITLSLLTLGRSKIFHFASQKQPREVFYKKAG